jgi:hypothetical protein
LAGKGLLKKGRKNIERNERRKIVKAGKAIIQVNI